MDTSNRDRGELQGDYRNGAPNCQRETAGNPFATISLNPQLQGSERSSLVSLLGGMLAVGNHDGELTLRSRAGQVLPQAGGRTRHDLLELFGHLARDHDLGVPEYLGNRVE